MCPNGQVCRGMDLRGTRDREGPKIISNGLDNGVEDEAILLVEQISNLE